MGKDIQKRGVTCGQTGRLKLSEPEVESYSRDLNAILNYVDTLSELNTDNINP